MRVVLLLVVFCLGVTVGSSYPLRTKIVWRECSKAQSEQELSYTIQYEDRTYCYYQLRGKTKRATHSKGIAK